MAFPTTSLTNNRVHKEGNRSFVYDSATGVWDRVREADNSNLDIQSGNIGPLVTGGAGLVTAPLSHRNLIINGAFQMWQRSDSTSLETVANNGLKADRFKLNSDIQAADLTCARSTDVPEGQGFTNSMKVVPGGADTNQAAGHIATIVQWVEAQDLQHLCYGTPNAKSLTLSFWVKTNLTGSHSVSITKPDNTGYAIPIEYTVSAANTWEKKEITISPTAGSTALITNSAGAISNDNGVGFGVCWNLAAGSSYRGTNNTWQAIPASGYGLGTSNIQNFVGSTSNNIYLTGIQLEVGSAATPFEHRSSGDELQRCYRYYIKIQGDGSNTFGILQADSAGTSRAAYGIIPLPGVMRTVAYTFGYSAVGHFWLYSGTQSYVPNGTLGVQGRHHHVMRLYVTTVTPQSMTQGRCMEFGSNTNGYLTMDAEL